MAATHKPAHEPIAFRDRVTCTVAQACEATGLGRDTIYRRIKAGELVPRKLGKRTLLPVPQVLALVGEAEGRP